MYADFSDFSRYHSNALHFLCILSCISISSATAHFILKLSSFLFFKNTHLGHGSFFLKKKLFLFHLCLMSPSVYKFSQNEYSTSYTTRDQILLFWRAGSIEIYAILNFRCTFSEHSCRPAAAGWVRNMGMW